MNGTTRASPSGMPRAQGVRRRYGLGRASKMVFDRNHWVTTVYYPQNKEKFSQWARGYRSRHPEIVKKQRHAHYLKNKEKIAARVTKYRHDNPEKVKEWARKLRLKNLDKYRAKSIATHAALKIDVFSHYAPDLKCVKCGFSDLRALSIDHIYGNGAKHRKQIGSVIYRWLKKNNYPPGYRVLCMNCQFIEKFLNRKWR